MMRAERGSYTLLERTLEARLRDGVRALGGMTEKVAPTRWGIPDRVVLLPFGQVFFVELKAHHGAVRPAQRVWHERAAALGTTVVVLQGAPAVDRWLAAQRFVLRKKWDAEHEAQQRARYPNDPTRNGNRGAARPWRVEEMTDEGWKARYTYSNEKKANDRFKEMLADGLRVRLVCKGKVVARTLAETETGAES